MSGRRSALGVVLEQGIRPQSLQAKLISTTHPVEDGTAYNK
jgi:hypothetical protein